MAALSIAVLALASVLVYVGIRRALLRNLDEALLALARTEIASAFDEPGGLVHVHDQAPSAVELGHGLAYEKVAQVMDAKGDLVARTSNLVVGPALTLPRGLVVRALGGEAVFADVPRDDVPYRMLLHPFEDADGASYAMVVAVSRRPLDITLGAVGGVLATALAVAGALAAVTAARVSRRLTRPIERIAVAARAVGETTLAARIPDVSQDRELRELVQLLNEMLGRIDAAFATQRRFVADASHELRSPLSNLRGTVEVALRHPRSATDYRDTLGVALVEIERLGRLVQSLLTLSRAGAGRLLLERRPADLLAVARQAIDAHGARAAERRVELRLDGDGPITVQGDADRLREVVDNLLDNAVRMAPEGSVVRVGVTRSDGRCALEVEDAGPGLDVVEQARVFEPFARGRAAAGDGAGLGLAIARAIATSHGGTLGVRSASGAGACFRLELPAG
jgi:two-component system OmpR family sensor kinase